MYCIYYELLGLESPNERVTCEYTHSISVGHFGFFILSGSLCVSTIGRCYVLPRVSHESPGSRRSSLSLQEPGGGRRESRHVFSIGSKGMSSRVGNRVRVLKSPCPRLNSSSMLREMRRGGQSSEGTCTL